MNTVQVARRRMVLVVGGLLLLLFIVFSLFMHYEPSPSCDFGGHWVPCGLPAPDTSHFGTHWTATTTGVVSTSG